MNKKILILVIIITSFVSISFANQPSKISREEFHKMLDKRLNLTQEQKQYIERTKPQKIQQMKMQLDKMQEVRNKIKDTYNQDIP